jgi:hypothetical protein
MGVTPHSTHQGTGFLLKEEKKLASEGLTDVCPGRHIFPWLLGITGKGDT